MTMVVFLCIRFYKSKNIQSFVKRIIIYEKNINGFLDAEIKKYQDIIESKEHLILEKL